MKIGLVEKARIAVKGTMKTFKISEQQAIAKLVENGLKVHYTMNNGGYIKFIKTLCPAKFLKSDPIESNPSASPATTAGNYYMTNFEIDNQTQEYILIQSSFFDLKQVDVVNRLIILGWILVEEIVKHKYAAYLFEQDNTALGEIELS